MEDTKKRKGIILAGGSGTRLYPTTQVVSKQLLPVYDKPMVYYPLTTLMLADISEILIISAPESVDQYKKLFGTGEQFGVKLQYAVQEKPNGLAEAFLLGEKFVGDAPSALVLGDNIFYGNDLQNYLTASSSKRDLATIFAYRVNDPERYGVVEIDKMGRAVSLEEKPASPKSNLSVTGLYFYPPGVSDYAKRVVPSARGELEITDLNRLYMQESNLNVEVLGRGFAWFDTGTHQSLLDASQFIATIEQRQGLKVACPEEIAFRKGWIDEAELAQSAQRYANSQYGHYLKLLGEGAV
jgi:glucose-1-phosphate thymidylyltransferase